MGSAPSSSVCGPCNSGGNRTEAHHYCKTCKEYLCLNCKRRHGRTKEETLRLPRSKTAFLSSDGIEDCSVCEADGRAIEANYYCTNCKVHLCNTCCNRHRKLKDSKDHDIKDLRGSNDPSGHEIKDLRKAPAPKQGTSTAGTSVHDLSSLEVRSSSKVNIKLPDDGRVPKVSGCAFLGKGELVVCDHANCKLLVLNSDLSAEVDYVRFFPNRPWDVSAINKGTIVVTVPTDKRLQFIQIHPVLCNIHKVTFDKKCFGVEVAASKIYITCHEENSTLGDVRELDINGNLLQIITMGNTLKSKFSWPYYITTSKDAGIIYVSDWKTNKITALTTSGNICFEYKSNMFETMLGLGSTKVAGLNADPEGNIIACGSGSNNLQIIDSKGKKFKTLLKSGDGLTNPYCVDFRPKDGTLVVGCESTELLIFKLA